MVTLSELMEEYWICRRGKRTSFDMASLEMDWMRSLVRLRDAINARAYTPGRSSAFVLLYPVAREVVAADPLDRVVHQYIDSRVRPLLEELVFDSRSFSCRKGKGTLYGVRMLEHDIRMETAEVTVALDREGDFVEVTDTVSPLVPKPNSRDCWVMHLDVKSCFMSIPRALLADRAEEFLRASYPGHDLEDLVYLSRTCILHNPSDNCRRISPAWMWRLVPPGKSFFSAEPGRGMGIGNLYVQLWFNFLMTGLDRLFDEHGLTRHGRYTDDSYAVCHDKARLLAFVDRAREWLASVGLALNERKTWVRHHSQGIPFTGAVVKPGRKYIRRRTLGGLADAIDRLNAAARLGDLGEIEAAAASVNAYCGLTHHLDEYGARRRALCRLTPEALRYVSVHRDHEGVRVRHPFRSRTRTLQAIRNGFPSTPIINH